MEGAEKGEIVILNSLGQTLKKIELTENEKTINIPTNSYQNGIYMVNLYKGKRLVNSRKLIVNH